MKKYLKELVCLGLAAIVIASGIPVYAGSLTSNDGSTAVQTTETETTVTETTKTESSDTSDTSDAETKADETETEVKAAETDASTEAAVSADDDNVVIQSDDKPYLALGADLTAEQQAVVLAALGVNADDLASYNVTYVTNAEEHQYLDSYIDSSKIGTKAWSSVVIVKRDKGYGIKISTSNINYCTIGMYKNALVTAGIEDADIIVAGPKPIAGTAALVGIFKAYTEISGGELSEENIDTALNELVLTGQLESTTGATADEIEGMVAYLKQQVAAGALTDENSISEAIDDACDQFDVTLTDEEKSDLIDLLLKIKDLDLDVDSLLTQAQSIYDKLADMGIDTSVGSGIGAKLSEFFSGIADAIKSFFSSIFS